MKSEKKITQYYITLLLHMRLLIDTIVTLEINNSIFYSTSENKNYWSRNRESIEVRCWNTLFQFADEQYQSFNKKYSGKYKTKKEREVIENNWKEGKLNRMKSFRCLWS